MEYLLSMGPTRSSVYNTLDFLIVPFPYQIMSIPAHLSLLKMVLKLDAIFLNPASRQEKQCYSGLFVQYCKKSGY